MIRDRNAEFWRIFCGDEQRMFGHFYGITPTEEIGEQGHGEDFAYGYWTPDEVFHQGIARWDGEQFFLRS